MNGKSSFSQATLSISPLQNPREPFLLPWCRLLPLSPRFPHFLLSSRPGLAQQDAGIPSPLVVFVSTFPLLPVSSAAPCVPPREPTVPTGSGTFFFFFTPIFSLFFPIQHKQFYPQFKCYDEGGLISKRTLTDRWGRCEEQLAAPIHPLTNKWRRWCPASRALVVTLIRSQLYSPPGYL